MAGSINDELYKALKGNYLQPLSLEDMYDDNALFRQGSSGQINDIMFGKTKAYGGQSVQDALYAYASTLGSATLSLNFLLGVLDPRITFTRASSATYFDSTGRLATASNDAPRFDYDPATLQPRGLLIEEQRTNLLLHSRDMTQAAWSKTDVTPTRNQVGIDGTANSACLMTEGSAGTASTSQAGASVTAGATITESFVVKRGNCDWIQIIVGGPSYTNGANAFFNLSTGVAGSTSARGAGTNISSSMTSLGGGWYRCTLTCTPDGTYTVPNAYIASASGNLNFTRVSGATYIVDAAQLEVGAFATSIITTGAATATRAADSASMTGTNFSSWYNQTAGTFVVEADLQQKAVQQSVATADDTTINNRIEIAANSAWKGRLQVVSGGVSQADVNSVGSVIAANTTYKICAVYAASDFQVALGGSLGTAVTSGTVPTVTRLVIGSRSDGVTTYNGHIRRLTYYPTRLSNATLQALML